MRIEHAIPVDLLRHRSLRILVVGAGGTGSAVVMGLPYLDQAMRVWRHRHGLEVALMDADSVSETNCVRQPFSVSDIGLNKATVLINRINLFWGTNWIAVASVFHAKSFDRNQDRCPDLVIGCVDTRAARRAIQDSFSHGLSRSHYWLDLGNNASSGQYVLGQPLNACNRRNAARLRTVSELYPEIVDERVGEDPLPSCSAAEALDRDQRQSKFPFGDAPNSRRRQLVPTTFQAIGTGRVGHRQASTEAVCVGKHGEEPGDSGVESGDGCQDGAEVSAVAATAE